MTKKFQEIFKELRLNETLNDYFSEGIIEEMFIARGTNILNIVMTLGNIVHPKFINELEKEISLFLSSEDNINVKIHEQFLLSYDLTLLELYEFYKDSLLYQIRKISPICCVKLEKAETIIEDNIIKYVLEEQVNRHFEDVKAKEEIIKIFRNKFNIQLEIEIIKAEEKDSVFKRFLEKRDKEEEKLVSNLVINTNIEPIKPKKIIKEQKDDSKLTDNLILGKKKITGQIIYLKDLGEETPNPIVELYIMSIEIRETKSGKILIMFDGTDFTNSISCKAFVSKDIYEKQVKEKLKKGIYIRTSGRYQFDNFQKEMVMFVNAIEEIDDFRDKREDKSDIKRVELHLHTQMSDMDAVVSAKDVVKRALAWGHKAVAITDHGVVQAFPDAFHAAEGKDIKILYGVEGYLVDDTKPIVRNEEGQSFLDEFIIFDIETTGFIPGKDYITEIGAVKVKNKQIIDRFSTFVKPKKNIPIKVQELTGITNDMVKDAPDVNEVLIDFNNFIGDAVLVAHNADFDMSFIRYFSKESNIIIKNTTLDTLELARMLFPDLKNHKLNTLTKEFNIPLNNHHRAVDDAEATALLFIHFINYMEDNNIRGLKQIIDFSKINIRNPKKQRASHVIIIAKNLIGLKNLYKLISLSHLNYYFKQPKIPKSVLNEYREGLIIGSACEAGELYRAILDNRFEEEIDRIVRFYDYLEIQPIGNNEFLIRDGVVDGHKELIEINKKIVELGEKYNKLVIASGDVHFMNAEDEVYRRILMAGKGFSDADNQAPLYYRTTEEMLQEFSYLGKDKAYEVVVENTNIIADKVEIIEPVPPEKYPPVIEGSEEELRTICYNKAKSLYGESLPNLVEERLKRELDSIIGNGFAVMYIIAQKLVWKSNEDGYLVGSRGSVGSSFAATMSGITEVNPLPAHYYCENCKYSDFESDLVKSFAGNSGCNLPDKKCPDCGNDLIKEGHDIPFETFLGFKGDKEPDIDLNFSGEYQSKAHEYTEILFGKGHVFRAGTIGTLAEKTAFGFVKKYFDERELPINQAEINRLIQGCTGVRRTTGQHPGGIIVVPKDQEIYKFTPVQHPANDMNTPIITTHFDYHSIDHNLLKLDILGHDDPTIIKMLEDLTGVDAKTIRLDEPKVMSLFDNTSALNIEPEDIGGCSLGCLGIPEFGTDFVMQMLIETKPKTFSDLVRISGLSHGADVWLNNAQELIKEGKVGISEVISTRDDIMTYLINQGVEKGTAFTIMESVRKGKGLKDEWIKTMKENNVPDWYIWSCKQIKYMFPKAHAVAYVMMAYRIAYFKVYYPLAYYTAFFSIRASDFDYEVMCNGKEHLESVMREYKSRFNELTKKEKDTLKDMRIVQEMYARGFSFEPIDLYKVDAKRFQIINGKIMPSLSAIQGLGEKAAENIVEARKNGEFISVEDLRTRTKISKTVIEVMKKNSIITGLPETNQLSLF